MPADPAIPAPSDAASAEARTVLQFASPLPDSAPGNGAWTASAPATPAKAGARAAPGSAHSPSGAHRLRSEALTHLIHEMRTPLSAIMGFNKINQFTDQLGREQRIANSAAIARNCERLLALINDRLELARIESGALAINLDAHDPQHLLREVFNTALALASGKPLGIDLQVASSMPGTLLLDEGRLRQVLLNLLGNAVKFTAQGTVQIWARWDTGTLHIAVSDSGPGIAPAALERIWDPYQQADAGIAQRFGGTGLGLAISRQLIELMGGQIAVRSTLGLGSTFSLTLPADALKTPLRRNRALPVTVPGAALKGHVLIADDSDDLRSLLDIVLRGFGLSVGTAANGFLAAERVAAEHFDLVLLDMEMPVMDGYETAQVLRTRGFDRPIIGFSAATDESMRSRALLAGCDMLLQKPVCNEHLRAELASALVACQRDE